MSEVSLSRRALNRATLARQLLLERVTIGATELLERLVGIQAQEANSWYTSFWTRIADFDPEEVSRLLEDRALVRTALMRSTIHLVTADDALRLRPAVQPAVERPMAGRGRTELRQHGLDDIVAAGRELLDQGPLTAAELGKRLAELWPDEEPSNLVMAVRVALPLVQVPPRGLWGKSGAARHATLESWVGRPLDTRMTADELVLRYLGALGPATPADAAAWSGLTGLRDVFERLRHQLVVFRGEDGRELFDLPDAPRPDPDTPAPVRFLATYDNVLLGHEDRTRFLSEELRRRLLHEIGMYSYGSILVDGFAAGLWRIERARDTATLLIRPVRNLSAAERDEMTSEGYRLLDFWAGKSPGCEIRFERVT